MKVIINNTHYYLGEIAAVRGEVELYERLGAIDYINYLRVYKSIDAQEEE